MCNLTSRKWALGGRACTGVGLLVGGGGAAGPDSASSAAFSLPASLSQSYVPASASLTHLGTVSASLQRHNTSIQPSWPQQRDPNKDVEC